MRPRPTKKKTAKLTPEEWDRMVEQAEVDDMIADDQARFCKKLSDTGVLKLYPKGTLGAISFPIGGKIQP